MVGPEIGVLTVSDQVRSQTVALSGTGIAPPGASVTPASLTFAALGVGQTSAAQTLTVSNRGGGPLAISGITANGDFSLPAADNTCGAILMPSASCTAQVVFTPTVGGQRAGSVSLADNAPGSPQMVTLTGTGVDFSLASDGPATATISSGGSGVYGLLLSSATGVPGTATFACSGAPANATCTVTPADPPLGSTTVITVTIETGVVADAELQRGRQTLWLATLLLGVGWLGRRRLPMRRLFGVAAICGMLLAGGCGSSRVIPPDGVGGGGGGGGVVTPPGTYAITVIATSAGLSRTVTLLLVVQ
jgi:hypothetical protein